MERMQREETPQLGVSEGIRTLGKNLPESFPQTTRRGHGKDTKGRNPSVGVFRSDKVENWPESFHRKTRKGYGKDTKARNQGFQRIRII
jgi:hypothetical protein